MDMLNRILGMSELAPGRLRGEFRKMLQALLEPTPLPPGVELSRGNIVAGLNQEALISTEKSLEDLLHVVNELIQTANLENARVLGGLNFVRRLEISPAVITSEQFALINCLPRYDEWGSAIDFNQKIYLETPSGVVVMLYVGFIDDPLGGEVGAREDLRVAVEVVEPREGVLAAFRQRFMTL